MDWTVAIAGGALLLVSAFSRPLGRSPVSTAMVFVAVGLLVGPGILDVVVVPTSGSLVRSLAEAALALVLFCDAARIDLGALRHGLGVPARLLGIGLPLTIAAGAAAAIGLFGQLTLGEALILGVILAPTDAALGQAVVSDPGVPTRIRQGLNVESGLNDGICVPLLFAAIAAADVESDISGGHRAVTLLIEEIGYGVVGGVVAALAIFVVVRVAGRRGLISPAWRRVIPIAGAAIAYGLASALGGSGFIAAFSAGLTFRALLGEDPGELDTFAEELGSILSGLTLFLFGAVLLGPALGEADWRYLLFAVLSLTAVRMIPVALAMLGSGARAPSVAFLGWFGPRGLASIVFALILVEESHLPHQQLILIAIYLTVGLSVIAHGASAVPLSRRYGDWHRRRRPGPAPAMEATEVEVTRTRHPPV